MIALFVGGPVAGMMRNVSDKMLLFVAKADDFYADEKVLVSIYTQVGTGKSIGNHVQASYVYSGQTSKAQSLVDIVIEE